MSSLIPWNAPWHGPARIKPRGWFHHLYWFITPVQNNFKWNFFFFSSLGSSEVPTMPRWGCRKPLDHTENTEQKILNRKYWTKNIRQKIFTGNSETQKKKRPAHFLYTNLCLRWILMQIWKYMKYIFIWKPQSSLRKGLVWVSLSWKPQAAGAACEGSFRLRAAEFSSGRKDPSAEIAEGRMFVWNERLQPWWKIMTLKCRRMQMISGISGNEVKTGIGIVHAQPVPGKSGISHHEGKGNCKPQRCPQHLLSASAVNIIQLGRWALSKVWARRISPSNPCQMWNNVWCT